MNTLPLVLPELRQFLLDNPREDVSPLTLSAVRTLMQERANTASNIADNYSLTVRESLIPGLKSAPDIRLLIVHPKHTKQDRPALLHLHGGGYLAGLPEQSLCTLRRFAHELDCVVVSPDYRLTPETPFPGPVEDCYATLLWMAENAGSLGIDPNRIALTGESAGGGLAAALALMTRDLKGPRPIFQDLVYPMLDDRTVNGQADASPVGGEFVWTRASNTYAWEVLLSPELPGSPDISPYAAPARATDLTNLPPAYISTGALDLFLDENLIYAQRLIHSGISVELDLFPGTYHAFDVQPDAPVAQRARQRRLDVLKRAFSIP